MEVSFRGVWVASLMLIRVLCDSLVLIMEGEKMAMVSRLKKEEEWRREIFFGICYLWFCSDTIIYLQN